MVRETLTIALAEEAQKLLECLQAGDPHASHHLARLIEADTHGALVPFAEVLAARIQDHLTHFAELNVTNPDETLNDEVYQLLKAAATDWMSMPGHGRLGEESADVDFV